MPKKLGPIQRHTKTERIVRMFRLGYYVDEIAEEMARRGDITSKEGSRIVELTIIANKHRALR